MKLRPSQKHTVNQLVANEDHGALLKPGLGKTLCALKAFEKLKKRREADYMLLVAPLNVIYLVWEQEIKKWGFDFKYVNLHQGTKKEREAKLYEEGDIYAINYESLEWLVTHMVEHQDLRWDIICLDESSAIKDRSTKRFKLLKMIRTEFDRRWILTGSPRPNSIQDLWSQIYFLDGGASLGKYITHFRREFFTQHPYLRWQYDLLPGAEKEIYDRIAPLVTYYGKEELKDLPPVSTNVIKVQLPPKVRKLYKEMEENFFIAIEDNEVNAANAAVKGQKLRQICNGGVYDEERTTVQLHTEKDKALYQLLEELQGDPLLLGYEFQHDLERIQAMVNKHKHLKNSVAFFPKGATPSEKKKIEREWNAGKYSMLVGPVKPLSHGLNLQMAGCNVALYSMIWSLELYEQFYQRVWRSGQTRPVVFHHFAAADTVDEVVIKAVESKDKGQNRFFTAMRKYREKVMK